MSDQKAIRLEKFPIGRYKSPTRWKFLKNRNEHIEESRHENKISLPVFYIQVLQVPSITSDIWHKVLRRLMTLEILENFQDTRKWYFSRALLQLEASTIQETTTGRTYTMYVVPTLYLPTYAVAGTKLNQGKNLALFYSIDKSMRSLGMYMSNYF